MATPIGAGGATLIRQYFREGYYPTGRKVTAHSMSNPSAALLKAVIINGAVAADPSLSYYIDGEITIADTIPSYIQGYSILKF